MSVPRITASGRSTTAEMAHCDAYTVVVSERSGETEDAIIADLTVARGETATYPGDVFAPAAVSVGS